MKQCVLHGNVNKNEDIYNQKVQLFFSISFSKRYLLGPTKITKCASRRKFTNY